MYLQGFLIFAVLSLGSCDLTGFEKYLATKTAYRFVANNDVSEIQYEGCTPTKIWAMIRHGTRYPEEDEIDDMLVKLPKIRDKILDNLPSKGTSEINSTIINLFESWSSQVDQDDVEILTPEGEEELFLLGQRYQSRFPSILSKTYTENSYKFRFTNTQRTEQSCKSFAKGLFGEEVTNLINFPTPAGTDPILQFYELCSKWDEEVNSNKDADQEKDDFEDGSEMSKTIEDVNDRLGLNDDLDWGDLNAMYKTCAFETDWKQVDISPWCAAFDIEDFKIISYEKDLKHYWLDGYGYEITYKPACVVINDLVDFFQNDEADTKASLYFTHSGTLLKVLAYLGLYKDENVLLADNYEDNIDRKYRVSYIDTFANNIFFVSFDCQGEPKILTLHQERPVRLPSCPDSDLCSFDSFVDYYASSSCNFDKICDN